MKSATSLVLFALITTACFAQNKKVDTPKAAQSIAELQQQLEEILKDTHTPGPVRRHRASRRSRMVRRSWAVSVPLLITAFYLAYWGMIGFRPWA
jgi:hypothetical protein